MTRGSDKGGGSRRPRIVVEHEGAQPWGAVLRFVRFSGTSLICTAVDQLIAGIIFVLWRKHSLGTDFLRILVGSLVARCFSQALNYALNHRLVFKPGSESEASRQPSRRESLPRFFVVAVTILTLSIIGVFALHQLFGIQESVAKVMVDGALFFLNYYLQRNWVFATEPRINPRKFRKR